MRKTTPRSRPKSTLQKLPGMAKSKSKSGEKEHTRIFDLMKGRYSSKTRRPEMPRDHAQGRTAKQMHPDASLMPPNASQMVRQFQGSNHAPPPPLDLEQFEQRDFDPEAYVSQILREGARTEQLTELAAQLKQKGNRSSTEMQKNVNDNYTQLVVISKEVTILETEVANLRGLFQELRLVSQSIQSAKGDGMDEEELRPTKAGRRSSVADLAQIYASQLQQVWKHVEGAQKFLPLLPGRHVIRESPRWHELNAATWKPHQGIHIFLLNDNFLVARRKKGVHSAGRGTSGSGARSAGAAPLIAERCWPLAEIELTEATEDAIIVRMGNESFVYRTDRPLEKTDLMSDFKRAAYGLRKAMRAETEEQLRMRDSVSYITSRDPSLRQHVELLKDLSTSLASSQPAVWTDSDGIQRDVRWLEDRIDELDVDIAQREYEKAVNSIERGRNLARDYNDDALASKLIELKLSSRVDILGKMLCRDLATDNGSKKAICEQTSHLLIRLGYEDLAKDTFLKSRAKFIAKQASTVEYGKDVCIYIHHLSFVYFWSIRHTIETYQDCFRNMKLASALVAWIKTQIEGFANTFMQQLVDFNRQSPDFIGSLEAAKSNCALLLDVGVDMGYLLDELLLSSNA